MTAPAQILIVDDEAPARMRLRNLLNDIIDDFPHQIVGEAANGIEALQIAEANKVDIALVDIRMPCMDGIELARHFTQMTDTSPTAVLFVTAYDKYAIKAFELSAIDYLLKPFNAKRLLSALCKAKRLAVDNPALQGLLPNGRTHIRSVMRGHTYLVPTTDVIYFKAELKYVTARTLEREYIIEESLSHLEEELSPRFIRVHRNAIVSRRAISGFARTNGSGEIDAHWVLLLKGIDDQLAISRRQWPFIKEILER